MSRIYCSNCGKLIPAKSNFCRFCGAAQHGHEAAVYQAQNLPVTNQIQQAETPPVATQPQDPPTIERRHLAKRAKLSFFFSYTAKTIIVPIGLIVLEFVDPLLATGLLGIYLFFVFAITELVYNHFYYSVDKTHFNKEFGIFFKRHVTIPFEQIQNVNIKRTLLDQLLGLARVDIESAGSSEATSKEIVGGSISLAEGHLPGLTLRDAKEFHDLVLKRVSESQ